MFAPNTWHSMCVCIYIYNVMPVFYSILFKRSYLIDNVLMAKFLDLETKECLPYCLHRIVIPAHVLENSKVTQ